MSELIIWTLDWVPEGPRGFVRDMRLRWACEEAGLPYAIRTVAFEDRATNHLARQPFGQVPFLNDGDVKLFESGACLIHLARKSDRLMPRDPVGEANTLQWTIAALNSIEMASVPWSLFKFFGDTGDTWGPKFFDGWVNTRLTHMEPVLAKGEWLVGSFSIADILMTDALRLVDRFDGLADYPACRAYVAHATARPAFEKAYADQMAHFAAAD